MLRPFDLAAAQAGAKVVLANGVKPLSMLGGELTFIFQGPAWVIAKDDENLPYVFTVDELRIESRVAMTYVLLYRRKINPLSIDELTRGSSQYFTATAFETEGAARAWAFDRQVEIIRIIPVEVEL